MSGKVVLVGALDTKGKEYFFVRQILNKMDIETITVDTGVLGEPSYTPTISAEEVARAAGDNLDTLISDGDRGKAIAVMTEGVKEIMQKLMEKYEISGAFGMGGTAGTTVASSALQALPIGVPKILVSTVASGNTQPYVGVKDITMMYSVIDIAGINQLSSKILSNAAHALAGMVSNSLPASNSIKEKEMIGLTMFGVTTPCCTQIREALEKQNYDVLVFHATGSGGKAMEELMRDGFIKGVIDATTTELADNLVGGVFDAGPNRLLAAGESGLPQVISVGALDMVNFGPPETVPEKFSDRHFYQHNPTTTLMRTTVGENKQLGEQIGIKLSKSSSPVVVIFPKGGVSMLDTPGNSFDGPEQREALLKGIKENLNEKIPLIELEEDINHPVTANKMVDTFLELMSNSKIGSDAIDS